jgi:hypothetical protein
MFKWLVRSSQKDIESAAFSHLATKIGEEPKFAKNAFSISTTEPYHNKILSAAKCWGIKRVADRSVQSFIGLKAYENELENTINNCFGCSNRKPR